MSHKTMSYLAPMTLPVTFWEYCCTRDASERVCPDWPINPPQPGWKWKAGQAAPPQEQEHKKKKAQPPKKEEEEEEDFYASFEDKTDLWPADVKPTRSTPKYQDQELLRWSDFEHWWKEEEQPMAPSQGKRNIAETETCRVKRLKVL